MKDIMDLLQNSRETLDTFSKERMAIRKFCFIAGVATDANFAELEFLEGTNYLIDRLYIYKEAIEKYEATGNLDMAQEYVPAAQEITLVLPLFGDLGSQLMDEIGNEYKEVGKTSGAEGQVALLKNVLESISDDYSKKVIFTILLRILTTIGEANSEISHFIVLALETLDADVEAFQEAQEWYVGCCLPFNISLHPEREDIQDEDEL